MYIIILLVAISTTQSELRILLDDNGNYRAFANLRLCKIMRDRIVEQAPVEAPFSVACITKAQLRKIAQTPKIKSELI